MLTARMEKLKIAKKVLRMEVRGLPQPLFASCTRNRNAVEGKAGARERRHDLCLSAIWVCEKRHVLAGMEGYGRRESESVGEGTVCLLHYCVAKGVQKVGFGFLYLCMCLDRCHLFVSRITFRLGAEILKQLRALLSDWLMMAVAGGLLLRQRGFQA
jgi:hypothetical protein